MCAFDYYTMMQLRRDSLSSHLLSPPLSDLLVPTDVSARADDISTSGQTDKQAAESCDLLLSVCLMWFWRLSVFVFSHAEDEEPDYRFSQHTWRSDVLQTMKWFCGKRC